MDVRGLILRKLSEVYPEMKRYGETIPQGFKTPCFSVHELSSDAQRMPNGVYRVEQTFDVRFFPDGDRPKAACQEMGRELLFALELLPGNVARGTNMNWQITNDVLHFFVTYRWAKRLVSADEAMEDIKTNVTAGGA